MGSWNARSARSKRLSWIWTRPGRFVCRPAQQPWSATSDLHPLQSDRACRLWREISSGVPHIDQPGGIRGQFLGCEKDGQKPANALVPLGRSSHAAGQSGDGERQSTTTASAQARPADAAPPPDLSTNPAFAQSRIRPRVFAALRQTVSRSCCNYETDACILSRIKWFCLKGCGCRKLGDKISHWKHLRKRGQSRDSCATCFSRTSFAIN